ncbi:MAG TPA: SDR family NAD(P)-dependent oxidoreductase [Acidobacteriota bacterium]|nr:SDR family NAD(P)-dependent oxidoreductase [Acidobacteriota bacterium]
MTDLKGLRTVVTGASKGIGRAVAERLADEGAKLALMARTEELLLERASDCNRRGAEARPYVCDVSDAQAVADQFTAALEWLGGIDLLVNNAGLGYFGSIEDLSVGQFDEMIGTNLRGVFLCSRAVVPRMKSDGGGMIVNIASIAGKSGSLGGAGYCASKFGVMGLNECMGLDLRSHGIRVTAICPGSVNAPDFRQGRSTRIKSENMIQASDVAEAVAYVAHQPPRIFLREIEIRLTRKE